MKRGEKSFYEFYLDMEKLNKSVNCCIFIVMCIKHRNRFVCNGTTLDK